MTYDLDFRKRVLAFVKEGGSICEAAKKFKVSGPTVRCFIMAEAAGTLEPKVKAQRKIDPVKLLQEVTAQPNIPLIKLARLFGVSRNAVWLTLQIYDTPWVGAHKRVSRRRRRKSKITVPTDGQ